MKTLKQHAKRTRESFPGYPQLKRVVWSERYGRMELLEVHRTSDGYLVGTAKIGEGDETYIHEIFIGDAK